MPKKTKPDVATETLKEAIMEAMENLEPGEIAVIHRYFSDDGSSFNHSTTEECECNPLIITAGQKKMAEDEIELVAMMMMAEMMYADQTKTYH